jgi:uncharacterized protein YkwD
MSRVTSAVFAVLIVYVAVRSSIASSQREFRSRDIKPSADRSEPVKAAPAMGLSSHEHRLVRAVNEYREKRGLKPLRVDPILMSEARQAAPHYSHEINGKWCWHRCRRRGFCGWATDNLANGHPTPEDAVDGWADSDGHARQMRGYFKMNGRWQNYQFDRIGVGVSGRKYIAIFGRENVQRVK